MKLQAAKLCLLLGAACIYGCVSVVAPIQQRAERWQQRTDYLYQNQYWTAHLSLLAVARQQKFNTRVEWRQQAERYQIKLKDFIGRTWAVIEGAPPAVTVKTSGGRRYQGHSAEALINELLGMRLPVSGLRYWLQGLPQPQVSPARLVLSEQGLAEEISQSGWQITYPHYRLNNAFNMPGQVLLRFDDVTLNVKVSQWVLGR